MLVDDAPLALFLVRHMRHSSLADDQIPLSAQALNPFQVDDVSQVCAFRIGEYLEARVATVPILRGRPLETRPYLSTSPDDSTESPEYGAVALLRPTPLIRLRVPADEGLKRRLDLVAKRRPG